MATDIKAQIIGENQAAKQPENVNSAVKSSPLLGFLEPVPDVAAKLKKPNAKDESFGDVVKPAREAALLALVY